MLECLWIVCEVLHINEKTLFKENWELKIGFHRHPVNCTLQQCTVWSTVD